MKRLKTVLVDDRDMGGICQRTMNFAGAGRCVCRLDSTVLYMDDRALEIFDLKDAGGLDAVIGKKISDFFQRGNEVSSSLCNAMSEEPIVTCLGRSIKTPAGNEKWLLSVHQVEWDSEIGEKRIQCRIWDVTQCRCAQEERDQEKAFYKGLIENSSAPTFVLDPQHRVLVWNKACEELTGIRSGQVLGTDSHWKGFCDTKKPCLADALIDGDFDGLGELFDCYSRSVVLSDGWRGEGRFKNAKGEIKYLIVDSVPIRGADGELIAVIETMEDITDHKQAEEALHEKDEQLNQLQKMNAVGRLAGGIAHDFNNLLTSILGYSRLVRDRLGEDHEAIMDLDEVIHSGERAAKLTKQLLTLTRKQAVQTHPINLNAVVVDMARLLRRTLGEHIELVIHAEPQLWSMMGDTGLIEQVIMNLAVNARDAMPDGGKLTIQTHNVTVAKDYIEGDESVSSGKYVVLTVRDVGHGMSEEVRSHLFEPFFTTKGEGKGAGLGLSTVYGIVGQLQGRIDFVSEPSVGTTFMIHFPALDMPAEKDPDPATETIPGGGETILVAEDEEAVRRLVVRMLKMLGYRVLEAADGVQAQELFEQYEGHIDLVLTDVVMPRMGGQELVRNIRQQRRDFKVLFSSGFTNGALVDHGLLDGGDDIMLKPYTIAALGKKVRQVLDER